MLHSNTDAGDPLCPECIRDVSIILGLPVLTFAFILGVSIMGYNITRKLDSSDPCLVPGELI